MQIIRPSLLSFPPVATPAATSKPVSPATPAPVPPVLTEAVAPPENGVTYTSSGKDSADLNSMTLKGQLEYGRNQGVFTKITLHKDGVLVASPNHDHSPGANGFVTSAVTTMQDFQEGIALLKQHSPDPSSKAMGFLSDKLRGLQNVASKLNVFA